MRERVVSSFRHCRELMYHLVALLSEGSNGFFLCSQLHVGILQLYLQTGHLEREWTQRMDES